jgi:hypothetical protein
MSKKSFRARLLEKLRDHLAESWRLVGIEGRQALPPSDPQSSSCAESRRRIDPKGAEQGHDGRITTSVNRGARVLLLAKASRVKGLSRSGHPGSSSEVVNRQRQPHGL